ncbi:kinase-like domain-containing protein [Cerioporus squamosus]|nr:kinase-like domain-containing protein [Cerioporus squamosus]
MVSKPPRSKRSERGLLTEGEIFWRERYDWLRQSGYELRPRYRPDWTPSWTGTNKLIISCEDGVALLHTQLIDAVRTSDGRVVVIKQILKSVHPYEVNIGRYLASPPLSDDPRNHCCPILDVLQDPRDPDIQLVVMPFLRQYNDPKFGTVGEAVEFFRQALEGLQFMHEHHVAHRDIMTLNVMMDPKPLFPDLYHPAVHLKTRDFKGYVHPYSRTARPVKYYWTDFGLSRRFDPQDTNPLAVPIFGGDRTVPEYSKDPHSPCNPFRVDVYNAGNLIREGFLQVYKNLAFMEPLVSRMCSEDPEKRPTMSEVISEFQKIMSNLRACQLRQRLVERKDGAFMNLLKGVHHISSRTIPNLLAFNSPLPTPQA